MRIDRLILTDIGSYRDLDLSFADRTTFGIWGPTGSGKSSILEAVVWCVWGWCRRSHEERLVRRGAIQGGATVQFVVRGVRYRVTRLRSNKGRGSGTLDFEQESPTSPNGWATVTGGNKDDVQAAICERTGLTAELALATVFSMQGRAAEFIDPPVKKGEAKGTRRRAILTELGGMDRFSGEQRAAVVALRSTCEATMKDRRRERDERLETAQGLPAAEEALAGARHGAATTAGVETAARERQTAAQGRLDAEAARVRAFDAAAAAADLAATAAGRAETARDTAEWDRDTARDALTTAEAAAPPAADPAALDAAETAYQDARTEYGRVDAEGDPLRHAADDARARLEAARRTRRDAAGELLRKAEETARAVREAERAYDQAGARVATAETAAATALRHRQEDTRRASADAYRAIERADAAVRDAERRAEFVAVVPCQTDLACADRCRSCPALADAVAAEAALPDLRGVHAAAVAAHAAAVETECRTAASVPEETDELRDLRAAEAAALERLDAAREQNGAAVTAADAATETSRQDPAAEAAAVQEADAAVTAHRARLDELKRDGAALRTAYDVEKAKADAVRTYQDVLRGLRLALEGATATLDQRAAEAAAAAAEAERLRAVVPADPHPAHAEARRILEEAGRAVVEAARQAEAARAAVATAEREVSRLDAARADAERLSGELAALDTRHGRLQRLAQALADVPAIWIETIAPEVEAVANEQLATLTTSNMQIQLVTRVPTRDGKGWIETLEILTRDDSGEGDAYDASGGEGFSVAWMLRVALARVLASRARQPLDGLYVDEGFGALDPDRIAAAAEVIGKTARLFDQLVVITHVQALADALPACLHVTKSRGAGSVAAWE